MHQSQTFNWVQYAPSGEPVNIKVESFSDSPYPLFSPSTSLPASLPTTPSTPQSTLPSSLCRRRSTTSLTGHKRVRPYPSVPRENRFRAENTTKMATAPAYATWSPSGTRSSRSNQSTERKSSDGDQLSPYSLHPPFAPPAFAGRSSDPSERRPSSSSGSSVTLGLTGAMGEAHLSSHSRHSGSPPSSAEHPYNVNVNQGMVWTSSQHPQAHSMSMAQHHTPYTGILGQATTPYHDLTTQDASVNSTLYHDYPTTYRNPASPESHSPPSPAFSSSYNNQFGFQSQRGLPTLQIRPGSSTNYSTGTAPDHLSSPHFRTTSITTQDKLESEVRHLRKRVNELDRINEHARDRIRALEAELARGGQRLGTSSSSTLSGPSSSSIPPPPSTAFQAQWKTRTDIRIRQFCSLNRAGNALCAWHDSRRERRAYPPRMAPAGHLNCGCTFEEALFEESLARHSVGSYHPGESVRMDPALRNPLLKLLQSRYGYRDGDFERDPQTGGWVEGEGPAYWEQKLQAGLSSSKKSRGESDRR